MSKAVVSILIAVATCPFVTKLYAQDMEPRAFSNAPIGTNFIGSSYAYSSGEVSLDPSIPITDIEADINVETIGYSRFFALAEHIASASVILPNYDGDVSGNVGEDRRKVNRTGLGDMRFRLAVNILGGPALTPEEFAKKLPTTSVGISLGVTAPTGEYKSQHLINIGANRWVFKPEIGITQPIGDWFVEGSAGASVFTDNHNFFGGKEREQDPIASFQFHTGYNFQPGLWMAADATYWNGGQSSIDGQASDDEQSSFRYGVTFSVPLSKSFSFKVAWSNGLITRVGGNFDTYIAAVQYRWFDS